MGRPCSYALPGRVTFLAVRIRQYFAEIVKHYRKFLKKCVAGYFYLSNEHTMTAVPI